MAAITTRLEDETADISAAKVAAEFAGDARLLRRISGLGAADADVDVSAEVAGTTHVALVNFQLARYVVQLALAERQLQLRFDPKIGYRIDVVPALPVDVVPWSRTSSPTTGADLLTYTTKMRTPSFSLPSGPPRAGGACPGAVGGQTISGASAYNKHRKVVLRVLRENPARELPSEPYEASDAICQHCYASAGSNYGYANNIAVGFIRFAWTKFALSTPTNSPFGFEGGPSNMFVDVMIEAIARNRFPDLQREPEPFRSMGVRFFRIHDSGDFFSKEYFVAWKAIADAFAPNNPFGFPVVLFWAPTRMWTVPSWIEFVDEINGGARNKGNFIIRPSAYSLNTPGPGLIRPGGGWAAHSTVYSKDLIPVGLETGAFGLNCGAYDAAERASSESETEEFQNLSEAGDAPKPKKRKKPEVTCQNARSPLPGYTVGCRACWLMPEVAVNYKHH